jgi:hypothetical protein
MIDAESHRDSSAVSRVGAQGSIRLAETRAYVDRVVAGLR